MSVKPENNSVNRLNVVGMDFGARPGEGHPDGVKGRSLDLSVLVGTGKKRIEQTLYTRRIAYT